MEGMEQLQGRVTRSLYLPGLFLLYLAIQTIGYFKNILQLWWDETKGSIQAALFSCFFASSQGEFAGLDEVAAHPCRSSIHLP